MTGGEEEVQEQQEQHKHKSVDRPQSAGAGSCVGHSCVVRRCCVHVSVGAQKEEGGRKVEAGAVGWSSALTWCDADLQANISELESRLREADNARERAAPGGDDGRDEASVTMTLGMDFSEAGEATQGTRVA
jgi:hypothetical protein